MRSTRNMTTKVVAGLLLAGAPMAVAFADEGVTWVIEPYLWLSSIRTSLNVDVPPIDTGGTTRFPDLVSKLSGAAEVHAEAKGDTFGALGDLMYVSVKNSRDAEHFSTKSDVSASITELAATWNPGGTRFEGFEAIAGVRNFGTTFDFKFRVADPSIPEARIKIDQNWTDFMIGGRYTARLSDRWNLTFRADGGFGDTDTNFNAALTASYKTGNGAWLFGYRYMDTKFDAANRKVSLELFGPTIAYAFVF